MNLSEILNNNYLFVSALLSIMALSLIFNSISIYNFYEIRKKISADYIKLQIWIINLVFTCIAIPYYILKETNIIHNGLIICNLTYMITDFIMFIYNNLLMLMALDRYFFICTKIRFHGKKILVLFYLISFLIASTSIIRIFQNECRVVLDRKLKSNKTADFLVTIYEDYIITIIMSINMLLTFSLYISIVYYVYKKSSKTNGKCVSLIRLNKDSKETSTENKINSNFFNYKVKKEKKMIHFKLFKRTKHWILTATFIKVKSFFVCFC